MNIYRLLKTGLHCTQYIYAYIKEGIRKSTYLL